MEWNYTLRFALRDSQLAVTHNSRGWDLGPSSSDEGCDRWVSWHPSAEFQERVDLGHICHTPIVRQPAPFEGVSHQLGDLLFVQIYFFLYP